jgi:hypothetical protein
MPMAWFFWIFLIAIIAAAIAVGWYWTHVHDEPEQDHP